MEPAFALLQIGSWYYQNVSYRNYDSSCSLWNRCLPAKVGPLNSEFYGRIQRNENGQDSFDNIRWIPPLPFGLGYLRRAGQLAEGDSCREDSSPEWQLFGRSSALQAGARNSREENGSK